MFQYASALCTIAKLGGNEKLELDENLRGWLLMNPARQFPASCQAVRFVRKKCRVTHTRNIRPMRKELMYGPPSYFFAKLETAKKCNVTVCINVYIYFIVAFMHQFGW